LALRLYASVPVDVSKRAALTEYDLAAGESASIVMEDASHGDDSITANPGYVSAAFKETVDYWRHWLRRSTYRGRWREIVSRSALALKLLTSNEHGSIVAALTFGLPEAAGFETGTIATLGCATPPLPFTLFCDLGTWRRRMRSGAGSANAHSDAVPMARCD
jgi:hypothetical protein